MNAMDQVNALSGISNKSKTEFELLQMGFVLLDKRLELLTEHVKQILEELRRRREAPMEQWPEDRSSR